MPLDRATLKAKRNAMAKVFESTQQAMGATVDELSIMRRSAVPYQSQYDQNLRSKTIVPIPADAHLIPSKEVIVKPEMSVFKIQTGVSLGASTETPWATYQRPTPAIFPGTKSKPYHEEDTAPYAASVEDEEMWRAREQEWIIQKNAYNPDVAAQMRCARAPARRPLPTRARPPRGAPRPPRAIFSATQACDGTRRPPARST